MKKVLGALIISAFAGVAYGQGTVLFQNFDLSGVNPAQRVFNLDGTSGLTGTGFTAQLWGGAAGTAESSLVALSPTVNFHPTLGGIFSPNDAVAVPGVAGGAIATLQVRVWNNQGGTVTSYASAAFRGASQLFNVTLADSNNPNQPALVPGMNSFALVPEPSVVVLALAGTGLLLLRRRSHK
jgi:hypothetical protein